MSDEMVTWKVKRIQEADYGCEERPEGEKTRVIVTLTDGKSGIRQLLVEDDWLYEQGIDEGSEWPEDRDLLFSRRDRNSPVSDLPFS